MIDLFLKYLQYEKNYSSHTVLSYGTDLEEFSVYIIKNNESATFDALLVDSKDIRGWVVELMDSGLSSRSVNRKISTLKSFYRFLMQKGISAKNPAKKLTALKTEKNLPLFFKEADMNAVLDFESSTLTDEHLTEFERFRNYLIITMFYETGMRLSELENIKDSDVDLSAKIIIVLGKRNKQRILPIGNRLCADIASYRQLRSQEVATRHDGYLYVRKNGEAMYPKLLYRIVHKAMTEQSSLVRCSPHVLRHTFATTMLNHGAELNAVKELLGHASLAATQVYTHTTFEQLRNIYKQAHPRA